MKSKYLLLITSQMKRLYLLLITILLTITLCFTEVKAYNGNEIIPFHPDPSLVTEWDVSELGTNIHISVFNTPIIKIIIPDEMEDVTLTFAVDYSTTSGDKIIWIFPPDNDFIDLEISYSNSYQTALWLGGRSNIPTMYISTLSFTNYGWGGDIYIYPDAYINLLNLRKNNKAINIRSYNFEYELSQEYQLGYEDGYDDGWGEKNKMTDITFLIIGLIIFVIANVLGFIYKNNLLTALSGLLWLLPIFLVDNIFIKIFSVIIMLITFLFSFKERGDYYV